MSDRSSRPLSAGAALEYAPAPPRGRKWVARAAALLLVLALAYAGHRWGPAAWGKSRMLYWQRLCLNYRPDDKAVVYEEEPSAAGRLLAHSSDYTAYPLARHAPPGPRTPVNAAARVPACWSRFSALGGIPAAGRGPGAVVFLHERISPAGNRRLVMVRYFPEPDTFTSGLIAGYNFDFEVLTPATLSRPAAAAAPKAYPFDVRSGWPRHPPLVRVYAGQADAHDPSHFTIRYQIWAQEDVLDGKLDDQDNITLTARHPPPDK
jgi:hypothetical protein